jgi:hypothetical protein
MSELTVGLLLAAALGAWVYMDAKTRGASRPELWGIGTFLMAILVLPAWLLTRPSAQPQPPDGPRLCGACRGPVQPKAAVCMHCGRDL